MKALVIDGLLLAPALVPLAVWKIFTLPPKLEPIKDLYHTLDYHNRLNRRGVDFNKPHEAYAWVPRGAEPKRVIALSGRVV